MNDKIDYLDQNAYIDDSSSMGLLFIKQFIRNEALQMAYIPKPIYRCIYINFLFQINC